MAYGGEVVEQGSGAVAAVEEEGQAAGPAPRRAPIGPAMPSHAMLMQAQQAAAEYAQQVLCFPPPACNLCRLFYSGCLVFCKLCTVVCQLKLISLI